MNKLARNIIIVFLIGISGYALIRLLGNELPGGPMQLWWSRASMLAFIAICLLPLEKRKAQLFTFLHEEGSARNLAILRFVFFFFSAAGIAGPMALFGMDVQPFYWGDLPDSARVALPLLGKLSWLPVDNTLGHIITVVMLMGAFLASIGLFTRWSALAFVLAGLYVLGVPNLFGKVNHNHFLLWFGLILAFSPSNHSFSLDALIRRKKGKAFDTSPNVQYGMPLKFIWLLFGVIYFFPGFWKIWSCGWDWVFTDNVRNQMYLKWLELDGFLPFFRIDQYPLLYKASGLITILFELSFIVMIFHKGWRWFAVGVGLIFHTSTLLFMNISFFILVFNYVGFVDWEKFFGRIKSVSNKEVSKISKSIWLPGIILLIGAMLFGSLKIHSWPLSCYPTFDVLVSDKNAVIAFEVVGSEGRHKLETVILKSRFSPERYRAMETQLILIDETDPNFHAELEKWGEVWSKIGVGADRLFIYRENISIVPEKRGNIESRIFLGSVELKN